MQQSPARTTQPIEILNDTFSRGDAREVLMGILDKQINSCKIRNWRSNVNSEQCCTNSMARIEELRELSGQFETLLQEARMMNKNVRIQSHFSIELID